jgi:hypothetical protein
MNIGGFPLIPLEGLDYIVPGDPRATSWGFTKERWDGSFLVLEDDRVMCSVLHASEEGAGFFRELLRGIEACGYRVAVPCPMPNMVAILKHYGFVSHMERADIGDSVDVWERPR